VSANLTLMLTPPANAVAGTQAKNSEPLAMRASAPARNRECPFPRSPLVAKRLFRQRVATYYFIGFSTEQLKLPASLVSPEPLYQAFLG